MTANMPTDIADLWAEVAPDLAQLELAQQRIARLPRPEPTTAIADVERHLFERLVSGEDVTTHVLAAVGDAALDRQIAAAAGAVVDNLRGRLRSEIEQTKASAADDLLKFLDAHLGQLVERVRVDVLPHLGDARTADDAIIGGPDAVGAWSILTGVVADYARLRGHQIEVTLVASANGGAIVGPSSVVDFVRAHGIVKGQGSASNPAGFEASPTDQLIAAAQGELTLWCPAWPALRDAAEAGRNAEWRMKHPREAAAMDRSNPAQTAARQDAFSRQIDQERENAAAHAYHKSTRPGAPINTSLGAI